MATELQPFLRPTSVIDSTHPSIHQCAQSIAAGLSTDRARAVAIHDFVRDRIRFGFSKRNMVLGPTSVTVKAYAVCSTVLYTKFFASTWIQGGKTFKAGNRAPEDAKLSVAKKMPKQTYGLVPADPSDARLARAREEERQANESVQVGAMAVYTVARIGHTFAFAHSKQPHRSIFWFAGVVCIFVGAGNTLVKVYAVCAGVLYVKFLVTTMIQGRKTFRAGRRAPEDGKLPMAKGMPQQTYGLAKKNDQDAAMLSAQEEEQRWRAIVSNDLESMPFALVVFSAGILAESDERVQVGAMAVYTLARLGHTYAYAHSLQPHRMLFWMSGVLSLLVGVGNSVVGAVAHRR
ncbi:hypothetical protein ATCC90586_001893 [Pythium insidiosum]|nr:hypothetical protein ATCC90586_001893 [Pythium insidiosum]